MSGSLVPSQSDSRLLVVDSWPVMEWLKRRQPVALQFRMILGAARLGELSLVMSSINLGEVYYNSWKEWDEQRADGVLARMYQLPIRIIHPTAADVLAAARLKGPRRIAYADGFAATLAINLGCPVLTGDIDFLILRDAGLVDVHWLGK